MVGFKWMIAMFAFVASFAAENMQTQTFAVERAARIGDVRYGLSFDLAKGKETYGGTVTIDMMVLDASADVVVDFVGASVDAVEVGGTAVNDFLYSPESGGITIPARHFARGSTTLMIDFTGLYVKDGSGFHGFIDPEDGREYHYTDFQPYHAHYLFPCFDQPDLKASYTVSVKAPVDWEIITNTNLKRKTRNGEQNHWFFYPSQKFSTYLFHLSAGPYAVWRDNGFRIPMALYARQSQAEYVDPEGFFEVSRKGFDFFEAYFDVPYPFSKYDQLFVPEFNAGAMENVGAVTFRESFLTRRRPPSQSFISSRASVIFHEMAHMWFGNLVTMKWWNDLWLNESFATYISYVAMEETGFPDAWVSASGFKQFAMAADQRVTTHPIVTEVSDTVAANSIFDAITYGKGLAVLRQFDYYLGGTTFRDGLREYFRRHAWQNTTLDDFLAAMQSVTDKPVEAWSRQWLETADLNTIQLEYVIEDGKMANSRVMQTPGTSNDQVRVHAVDIGLFYEDENGAVTPGERPRVVFEGGEQAVPELDGKPAPVLALPNISDYGYMKIALDDRSRDWVLENMGKIEDKQSKAMLWSVLWDMVRDSKLAAGSYAELAISNAPAEQDHQLLGRIVGNLWTAYSRYLTDPERKKRMAERMFTMAEEAISRQEPGSDQQSTWYSFLVNTASESGRADLIAQLFEGKRQFEGLNLDARRKWSLVALLTSMGDARAADFGRQMGEADPSAFGKNYQLYLSSLRPAVAAKEEAWQRVVSGENDSLRETGWIARGIHDRKNPELSQPFVQRFFDDLARLHQARGYNFSRTFNGTLFPTLGYEKTVKEAERFLERKDLDPNLKKMVAQRLDDLEREIRIREFSNKGGKS